MTVLTVEERLKLQGYVLVDAWAKLAISPLPHLSKSCGDGNCAVPKASNFLPHILQSPNVRPLSKGAGISRSLFYPRRSQCE